MLMSLQISTPHRKTIAENRRETLTNLKFCPSSLILMMHSFCRSSDSLVWNNMSGSITLICKTTQRFKCLNTCANARLMFLPNGNLIKSTWAQLISRMPGTCSKHFCWNPNINSVSLRFLRSSAESVKRNRGRILRNQISVHGFQKLQEYACTELHRT